MTDGVLERVARVSLIAALADARPRLVRFESFDVRGLPEIAVLVCELRRAAREIELELRRRSLAENSPLFSPVGVGLAGKKGRITLTQRACVKDLITGRFVARVLNGEYVVEAGEVGGFGTGSDGHGLGDWRSQDRKPGKRRVAQIIEALLLRGLVRVDEYGYVVPTELAEKIMTPRKRGRKKLEVYHFGG